MKRITQITISNYRAFYNEKDNKNKYQINLSKGENLLVYGENGSGKSSLYKAIEDLFLSANNESVSIQENIFTKGFELPPAEVKIKFSEKKIAQDWEYIEEVKYNNNDPNTNGNTLLTNSTQAFLTYREILKT